MEIKEKYNYYTIKMKPQQALQFIKNVLDAALKSGVIVTMEQAQAILQAFQVIQNAINTKDDTTGN